MSIREKRGRVQVVEWRACGAGPLTAAGVASAVGDNFLRCTDSKSHGSESWVGRKSGRDHTVSSHVEILEVVDLSISVAD